METTTRLILPEVKEALASHPEELLGLAEELHPADLADLAGALEPELALKLLQVLPIGIGARVLESCEAEKRNALFLATAQSDMNRAAALTDEMAADDRADLYAALPEELRSQLLSRLAVEESRDIRALLAYPEGTAGALMTTQFVALPASTTAAQAIELIRHRAEEMETIYQAYAVDPNGILLGVVSLRDLVTSKASRSLDEIMNPHIVSVPADSDQEEVARLIAKYDLLALPVVDRSHRIVGIITVDDVIDVVEEEATEDAQKMGAIEPLETPYLATPLWQLVRARAPWLIALFVASQATRNVMEQYQGSMDVVAATMLSWFVPLIVSSGGNSGSQSATLVIRALTVGSTELRDALRILGRELLVGLSLGGLLGVVGVVSVLSWKSTRSVHMAATIGLSVTAVVTMGALIGSGVPLLLRRLRIDPAVSSTPFIATLLDMVGLMTYFEIARLVFRLR